MSVTKRSDRPSKTNIYVVLVFLKSKHAANIQHNFFSNKYTLYSTYKISVRLASRSSDFITNNLRNQRTIIY